MRYENMNSSSDFIPVNGNHEGRALLTGLMQPGEGQRFHDFETLLWDLTPLGEVRSQWGTRNVQGWLERTMADEAGVVQIEGGVATLVPERSQAIKAHAAEALLIGEEHGLGLAELWGRASGPGGPQTPVTRFRIIEALMMHGGQHIRSSEIGEQLHLRRGYVQRQLGRLANSDLVMFTPAQSGVAEPEFEIVQRKDGSQDNRALTDIARFAYDFLKMHSKASVSVIANAQLDNDAPIEQAREVRYRTRVALNNYAQKNVVRRVTPSKIEEQIYFTPEQHKLWTDILSRYRRLESASPDYRQCLVNAGQEFLADEARVIAAVKRAQRKVLHT